MPKEIIEIKEYKKLDLRESILIDGFPSVGLISTIISNYYISAFNLDGMAFIDSPYFPPLTLVYAKKPKYPARIHASEDKKLTVISCEFTPAPQLVRAIGEKIVKWAITRHIHSIITFVGILEKGSSEQVSEVYAVGSTEQIRNLLSEKKHTFIGTWSSNRIACNNIERMQMVKFRCCLFCSKSFPSLS